MKRWGRVADLAVLASGLVLLLALPGCKTGGLNVRPANAVVSPEWSTLNVRTLAFLGLGSTVGDEVARQTAEQIAEEQFLSRQQRFVILGRDETRSRASSRDAGEQLVKLTRSVRNGSALDQFTVKDFCEKTGVDGILVGTLTDWKKERVDWTQEGKSQTMVGYTLAILSGKSGLKVWEAQKSKTKESLKYDPREATGVYTDTQGVSRTERADRIGPEPPRPEEVASDVLLSLMAAFPPAAPSK